MSELRQDGVQAAGCPSADLQGRSVVVCVKWGLLYGSEYVHRLYDGLRRNTTLPFRFICFTDDPSGLRDDIEHRPLLNPDVIGWWHKSWLFSDECGLTDQVVYMDLDTVITGNVDEMLAWRGEFIIAANPASRSRNPKAGNIGAMLMGWRGGMDYGRDTWGRVLRGGPSLYGNQAHTGDQRLMGLHPPDGGFRFWQDECPGARIVSYKADIRANGNALPDDVAVVCFHGTPRPHEVADLPWMQEHWREDA